MGIIHQERTIAAAQLDFKPLGSRKKLPRSIRSVIEESLEINPNGVGLETRSSCIRMKSRNPQPNEEMPRDYQYPKGGKLWSLELAVSLEFGCWCLELLLRQSSGFVFWRNGNLTVLCRNPRIDFFFFLPPNGSTLLLQIGHNSKGLPPRRRNRWTQASHITSRQRVH